MAEAEYHFICLDPRKSKRHAVETVLGGLGTLRFLPIVPLGWQKHAEAGKRAAAAMVTAKKQPKTAFGTFAKRKLLEAQYNGARALFARNKDAVAVAWNGLNGSRRVFMDAAKDAGNRQLYFELCPFKGRITVDPCGVNFQNSLPRVAAPYLQWAAAQERPPTWEEHATSITARQGAVKRGDAGQAHPLEAPFIFVPLQVPGDSQLRIFGGNYPTVESVVEAVARAAAHLPEGWHVRIKEHPTAKDSLGESHQRLFQGNVVLDNSTDTFAQVAASRAVITVNSSVGLEAMLFRKPVAALGQCFWAIPGVAQHLPDMPALSAAFAAPESMTFDPELRDAFLGFIFNAYYPTLDSSEATTSAIARRLQGADAFGFWDRQATGKD